MTLKQTVDYAYSFAIDGNINGEHLPMTWFENQVRTAVMGSDSYVFQIARPDGWWLCEIFKCDDGWEFYLPANRQTEARLKEELEGRRQDARTGSV